MTPPNTVPHPGRANNTYRRVLDEIGGGNPAPVMSKKTRDALESAGLIERLTDRVVGGKVCPINVRQYRMPAAVTWQWCAATGTPYPAWIKNTTTTTQDNTMPDHDADEIDALEPHMLPKTVLAVNRGADEDIAAKTPDSAPESADLSDVIDVLMGYSEDPPRRAAKRKSRLDADEGILYVLDAAGFVIADYTVGAIPQKIQDHLVLRGLWDLLRSADNPDEAFASLVNGDLLGRAALRGDAAWREAYAQYYLATNCVASIETARAKAALLDKKGVAAIKRQSKIVAQWEKLTGRGEEI